MRRCGPGECPINCHGKNLINRNVIPKKKFETHVISLTFWILRKCKTHRCLPKIAMIGECVSSAPWYPSQAALFAYWYGSADDGTHGHLYDLLTPKTTWWSALCLPMKTNALRAPQFGWSGGQCSERCLQIWFQTKFSSCTRIGVKYHPEVDIYHFGPQLSILWSW